MTSALRIAIVIERFAAGDGGVENVAWQVAHELVRAGDDVTVITREADFECIAGPGDQAGSKARPRLHRVRVPTVWQPLRVLSFSRAVARVAHRGPFDVVHSFCRTRHQDLFRAGGGCHSDYLRHRYSRAGSTLRRVSPRHRVLLSIEERVFRDPTQRIQCASNLVANALIAEHGVSADRILLLPNAVDASRFGGDQAVEDGRRLRARIGKGAERIWLFPASGWHRKGLPLVFEAMSKIRDPNLFLWIAGRDDARPWQKKAQALGLLDRIRFLGPRDDLEAVYSAVDGMVLPTRYDAFANVTLEAAAAGLPIITTPTNGAAQWLEDEVCLLENADDSLALAAAWSSLSGEVQRRDLGVRAQKKARQFDWPQHVERLRDEYQRIVDARRQGSTR
jgi:UDP-glucose:(heptosyl)LPS alpha-1,3-glucosyltransferase